METKTAYTSVYMSDGIYRVISRTASSRNEDRCETAIGLALKGAESIQKHDSFWAWQFTLGNSILGAVKRMRRDRRLDFYIPGDLLEWLACEGFNKSTSGLIFLLEGMSAEVRKAGRVAKSA